jgi:hypothetical protein
MEAASVCCLASDHVYGQNLECAAWSEPKVWWVGRRQGWVLPVGWLSVDDPVMGDPVAGSAAAAANNMQPACACLLLLRLVCAMCTWRATCTVHDRKQYTDVLMSDHCVVVFQLWCSACDHATAVILLNLYQSPICAYKLPLQW